MRNALSTEEEWKSNLFFCGLSSIFCSERISLRKSTKVVLLFCTSAEKHLLWGEARKGMAFCGKADFCPCRRYTNMPYMLSTFSALFLQSISSQLDDGKSNILCFSLTWKWILSFYIAQTSYPLIFFFLWQFWQNATYVHAWTHFNFSTRRKKHSTQ